LPLLAGILPIVLVSLLYLSENQLFPPGTTKGPVTAFLFCLFLLMPFCITTGMLFTMLASALSHGAGINRVSRAYSWESGGSMLAGLIFSLLIVYLLRTYQVLALILLLNLAMYVTLNPVSKATRKAFAVPGLLFILSVWLFFSPADRWIKSLHFINQELIYTQDSPYGNISVTQTVGQYNFYGNNTLLFSTGNQLMQEEAVHFAMLQHPDPENIMLVSGGISGMTNEVLKYRTVKLIDYFEINPWLVRAEKQYSEVPGISFLRIQTRDARRWIRKAGPVYDVMVISAPDPSNAQINRFFTQEFFAEAKKALRSGGILLTSLRPGNYIMHQQRNSGRSIKP
jgi:spermidine synthase